jgi:HD-GYP domain-containing protein (c-di-GMP phosphodiesterase class II)
MARVIAVADSLEAMLSNRPHRTALTAEAALAEIQQGAGSHFDPMIVQALLAAWSTESDQDDTAPLPALSASPVEPEPALTAHKTTASTEVSGLSADQVPSPTPVPSSSKVVQPSQTSGE